MPTICKTVLHFPQKFAATTIFFLAAIIFCASTITSLAIIITGIRMTQYPCHAKHINTLLTKTLSAIGSQNFPKSDTQLNFLAMKPSSQSVIAASTNKHPAIKKNR
ncbi:MAG: hypothetical protein MJ201_03935 [Mycoplasmoidaceae bacterium]|nr:hypothetical protein [Mycoplasmoidaceae bacterium]